MAMNSDEKRPAGLLKLLGGAAASALLATALISGPASAQVSGVSSEADQAARAGAASQERIDRVDDETGDIVAQYRQKLDQLEALQRYNKQLSDQVADQVALIESLNTQIEEASSLDRDIYPFMEEMLLAIENFIELDVPFLIERRLADVATVKAAMTDSKVTVAERFRLIMQLYTRENEYGSKISTYGGSLEGESGAREVTFLQIGRVVFLYITNDESEAGRWNHETQSWEVLPSSYIANVKQARRIADETAPPNLMLLPVQAAEAAQ